MRDDSFFETLKNQTGGMLSAAVYREMYKASLSARGNIIDIGVGRGATSISYALGILDSQRSGKVHAVDQFFQHSATKPHLHNLKTNPEDAVELNVREFERNASRYDVANLVKVWPGKTDEIAGQFPDQLDVGILSIDVDGYIDRDLGHFFDLLCYNGVLVVDDYSRRITAPGRAEIEKMKGSSRGKISEYISGLSEWKRYRMLGKHYLTHQLLNHFEKKGFLKIDRILESTAFCVKTTHSSFKSLDFQDIKAVKEEIIDTYMEYCR